MVSSGGYIFLSYSRKDTDFQKRIVTYLRGKGLIVWVDNEKLIPGTPIWESEIEKAITGASAILVLLSPDSKNSEWVRREITFAEQNHKRIFPVLVRGDEDSSMTLRLITRQYVDLRKNEKVGLQALYQSLNDYLVELEEQKQSALTAELAKSEVVEKARREDAQRLAAENVAREESRRIATEKRAREQEEKETRALAKSEQTKKQKEKSEQFWKTNKKIFLPGFAVIVLLVIGSVVIPRLLFGGKGTAVATDTSAITATKLPTATPTRTTVPSKTPSPTATATFTPTLLPTPAGQLIFEETFEQAKIQVSGPGFSVLDDGTGNKKLRTDGDTAWFDFGPKQFQYGTVEFDFRFHDEGESYTNYGTWTVSLNISKSASKSIILSTRPMSSALALEYRNPSDWVELVSTTDFKFHVEQWYTVQIRISETTMAVYVNGELVLYSSNDQNLVGSLGIDVYPICAAANQCPPAAHFDFDNIKVWIP